MLFAWIVVSAAVFKFLPWYGIFVVCVAVGFARPGTWKLDSLLSLVSGLVFAILTFLADGRNFANISKRMAGLFALPMQDLIFAVMFVLAFVSCLLALQSGAAIKRLSER